MVPRGRRKEFVKKEALHSCVELANSLFVKNGLPAIDVELLN